MCNSFIDLVGDFDEASKNESKVDDCKREHEFAENIHADEKDAAIVA